MRTTRNTEESSALWEVPEHHGASYEVQTGGTAEKALAPGVSLEHVYLSVAFMGFQDPNSLPFEAVADPEACGVPGPQEIPTCPRDGAPGQGPVRSLPEHFLPEPEEH